MNTVMYWLGLLLLGIVYAKHEEYDGCALYIIKVRDVNQELTFNSLTDQLHLDVWVRASTTRNGEVLVPLNLRQNFQNELNAAHIQYKMKIENIKKILDLEDRLLKKSFQKNNKTGLPYDKLFTYSEADAYLENLATSYPSVVSLVNAGKSYEGRDIKYVKISSTKFKDLSKPIVFIQSLLHAREWITLPVALYAIHKLVVDVTDRQMVQNVDWIILPIANPDGYEYSRNKLRFWRKNRSLGNTCVGVDLNRNYDINWSIASSNNPCSNTFHGRSPFSEPETQITRDILSQYGSRMQLFLDIHSYGSKILYGYGIGKLPANVVILHVVAEKMAKAIDEVKLNWNPNYAVGNVALVLYKASGSAEDYAQAIGVPLSYTLELPGYRYGLETKLGFLVEPNFITQAAIETWEGIKIGARFVLDHFKTNNVVYK